MSQQQSALAVKETNFIMSSNSACVASKKEVVISGESKTKLISSAGINRKVHKLKDISVPGTLHPCEMPTCGRNTSSSASVYLVPLPEELVVNWAAEWD
ncbi:hypothetical protein HGM15179_001465 [Zosterops borbonicus]|uniref:Uncharacterized protein n=1 Tax=Zosterops borbonicus TaxID=364589 RepID=A0A8K1LTF3_9PASS|nr:hypothetical protein HGM15179_001465 [Zosterops borbonicus]